MLRRPFVLGFALALGLAFPLAAQTDFSVFASRASFSTTATDGGDIHLSHGNGWGVSANHFWTRNLSTEIAATWLHSDGTLSLGGTDALSLGRVHMTPITIALQWHLAPRIGFDPYLGAGGAYVKMDNFSSNDLTTAGVGDVEIKSKTTWMANAGVNLGNWNRLSLVIDGKYIRYRPDSGPAGATVRLKVDPRIISAGLKYRF